MELWALFCQPPAIVGFILLGFGMCAIGSKLRDADYKGVVYAPFYILAVIFWVVLPVICLIGMNNLAKL